MGMISRFSIKVVLYCKDIMLYLQITKNSCLGTKYFFTICSNVITLSESKCLSLWTPLYCHCLKPISNHPCWKSGLFAIGVKTDVSFDLPSSWHTDRQALIVLRVTGLLQLSLMYLKFLKKSKSLSRYFEREDSTR